MMKKTVLLVLAVLLVAPSVYAVEVGGKNLPETITVGNETLQLNGAGIREKWFMDIYACGLYLKNKSSDQNQIMSADEPLVIRMVVISGLMTQEKMVTALNEGFEKSTGGNIDAFRDKIDKFIAGHAGEIVADNVIEYQYVPGEGTTVFRNGEKRTTIEGLDFKKAVVGIWLCDEPASESLKEKMLGK
jgi:hypothetical protein